MNDQKDSIGRRVVVNFSWLALDKGLRLAGGLLVGVWIARFLGPEQFGRLSFALAYIGLLGVVANLGLHSLLVREFVRYPEDRTTLLGTGVALLAMGGAAAAFLAIVGVQMFSLVQDVEGLVLVLAVSLLFKPAELFRAWFESQTRSGVVVRAEGTVFLGFLAVKVGLILAGAGVMAFAWAHSVEALACAAVLTGAYAAGPGSVGRWRFRFETAARLVRGSWSLLLSGLAIMIYMRVDQIMLGEMLGSEAVGMYSAAGRIAEAWFVVPVIVCSSIFPLLLDIRAQSMRRYLDRLQDLYNLLCMASILFCLAASVFSGVLINLLYGAEYSSAASLLAIQVWAGVFVAMGVARGKWLLAEDKQHIGYWYVGLAMLVNVAGNWLLIPRFGGEGAAVASVLAQAVTALIAPALFRETRPSAVMLVRSMNPSRWWHSGETLARYAVGRRQGGGRE